MQSRHLILLVAIALDASLPVLAGEVKPRGTLIRIHAVSEAHARGGLFKSQILTEFRLLEDMARQDVYIGAIKGNPQMQQTTLYLPREHRVISIHHKSRTYTNAGPEQLEEQKRTLRDLMQRTGGIATPRPTLTPTDEVDTLDGYLTRKFTAETLNGVVAYWIVDDDVLEASLKRLAELTSTPGGEMAMLRFPDPALFNGAPIKIVVETRRDGTTTTTTSLQSFEFDVVFDEETFAVPDGYELVSSQPELGLGVQH